MTLQDLMYVIVGFACGAAFAYIRCTFIVGSLLKKRFANDLEKILDALEEQGKIVRVAQR